MQFNFTKRRENIRKLMFEKGLDALFINQEANRFYLSGFELHDCQPNESSGYLLLTTSGKDFLLTDSRYEQAASYLWDVNNIRIYSGDIVKFLQQIFKENGIRIGFESKSLNYSLVKKLSNNTCGFWLEPADGIVEKLRCIKDRDEIKALEKSFALNHKMLSWLEDKLKIGTSEKEISWEIEKFFRENGAQELAFSNIVAVAKNGALPHAVPSDAKIKENTSVLVDVGCRVDNYCSDQTRTFWIGDKQLEEFKSTYALVKKAQDIAIKHMKPGVKLRDVYKYAYSVFEKAKVEKAFTHGLGHGVGIETHEKPSLSRFANEDDVLLKGMVVTVEPGLYYPKWGGVRLEYTVLVEEDGVRIL